MIIQIISLFYLDVFKKYSEKYKIFRELYEKDLLGLEIRNLDYHISKKVKKIILNNKEICFTTDKNENNNCDLLALGNYGIFKELSKEIIALGNEELGFKISEIIKNITLFKEKKISISEKEFILDKAYTFGILNVTPDSFSDGGKFYSLEKATEHGLELLEYGADVIDIGGESTRPGAEKISSEEEINRVIPVLKKILELKPNTIISIDTTKSSVAELALQNGAKIVNDISGFKFDSLMKDVVKKYDATCVIMHIKGEPKTMQLNPTYGEVISEIYDELYLKVKELKKYGVHKIIIDPGIGFGKRVQDNYEIIKRLNEFNGIGQPILVGLSRKSFLGKALNLEIDKREIPTLIAETIAIKNGARFIRTHNPSNSLLSSKINFFVDYPEQLND